MKESRKFLELRLSLLEDANASLVQACDLWQKKYDKDCPVAKLDDESYRRELKVLYDIAVEKCQLDLARMFLEKRQVYDNK